MASSGGTSRDENARVLAGKGTLGPKLAGLVPESLQHSVRTLCKRCREKPAHLPLAGEVAVTRRDAEEEGVELGELVGLDDRVSGLGGRVQLVEDVLREESTGSISIWSIKDRRNMVRR